MEKQENIREIGFYQTEESIINVFNSAKNGKIYITWVFQNLYNKR